MGPRTNVQVPETINDANNFLRLGFLNTGLKKPSNRSRERRDVQSSGILRNAQNHHEHISLEMELGMTLKSGDKKQSSNSPPKMSLGTAERLVYMCSIRTGDLLLPRREHLQKDQIQKRHLNVRLNHPGPLFATGVDFLNDEVLRNFGWQWTKG